MCTVTFVPTESGFIFTSNRDEINTRETIVPNYYQHGEHSLYYPKDKMAGGTWIATDGKSRLVCLLNGAFEKHERNTTYLKSRGRLLLEVFDFKLFDEFLEHVNLSGIEPFTMIHLEFGKENRLREIRWDEQELHVSEKSVTEFHIWSSATLYTSEIRDMREKWFKDWITNFRDDDNYNILNFHLSNYPEQQDQGIRMIRKNGMQTVSVSHVSFQNNDLQFLYYDILANKIKSDSLTKS